MPAHDVSTDLGTSHDNGFEEWTEDLDAKFRQMSHTERVVVADVLQSMIDEQGWVGRGVFVRVCVYACEFVRVCSCMRELFLLFPTTTAALFTAQFSVLNGRYPAPRYRHSHSISTTSRACTC